MKNWKNGENVKIEMRSFGTLYEPPGSQKKCSEELRSRSIDWRGQMVHKTKIKIAQKPKMETKVVVWDAIKSGIELEKMFWGAEIKIYLLVSSKVPLGTQNSQKKRHHNFRFWGRADVIFPTPKFWWFGAPDGPETWNFVLQTQFLLKI